MRSNRPLAAAAVLLLVAALLAPGTAAAAASKQPGGPTSDPRRPDAAVTAVQPVPDVQRAAHVQRQVLTYRTVGDVQLRLHMYRVVGGTGKRMVMLVHGGGWWRGGPEQFTSVARHNRFDRIYWHIPLAQRLARRGFVVVIPEYRLACGTPSSPRKAFRWFFNMEDERCGAYAPEQVDDLRAAVRVAKQNAGRWGANPRRLGMLGASAGGHLAMRVATSPRALDRPKAVAHWSGMPDTGYITRQWANASGSLKAAMTNRLGCRVRVCPGRWQYANPMQGVARSRRMPVFQAVGRHELQVSPWSVLRAHRRLAAAGYPVRTVVIPSSCHAIICWNQAPAGQRPLLEQTEAFLVRWL